MPGRSKAPKSGSLLKDKVVKLAQQLGLRVETEVKAARRIWGQRRYIDVVLIDDRTGKRLGIECKFQATLVLQRRRYLPLFRILLTGRFQGWSS